MVRTMKTLAAVVLLAAAAACVDADDEPGDDAATTDLPATQPGPLDEAGQATLPPDDGDLRSVEATLTEWSVTLSQESVREGAIAFNIRNTGSMVHRFEVEGNGEEWASEDINPGDEVTMSLSLSPGVYQVYCPIVEDGEDHEARGMTTTLRVN